MNQTQIDAGSLAILILGALALVAFGYGYARVAMWVFTRHAKKPKNMLRALLLMSIIGVAVPVLATLPLLGPGLVLAVFAALGLASAPVLAVVGKYLLDDEDQGDKDNGGEGLSL